MKTANDVLLEILAIVNNYLPPDGIEIKDAMSQIIKCVDPWSLVDSPQSVQPLPAAQPPPLAARPVGVQSICWNCGCKIKP